MDTWEDEGGLIPDEEPEEEPDEWPDGEEWIEADLLEDWDNFDDIDDYRYVEREN